MYHVEIVDDRQSIYFINELFEFPQKMANLTSTSMKKYLQISPSYLQSVIAHPSTGFKKEAENILENVKLGVRKEKSWDRKFKIRLTSKRTGRKIDLNVNFILKSQT